MKGPICWPLFSATSFLVNKPTLVHLPVTTPPLELPVLCVVLTLCLALATHWWDNQRIRFRILYTKWYTPHLLLFIFHNYFTGLLTSSIHVYETRYNKLCLSHVNTRFEQRILRYKGSQLWNRLPSNLTNSTASKSFLKKIVVALWPNIMYCNELFLDICHRDYYILNQTAHKYFSIRYTKVHRAI